MPARKLSVAFIAPASVNHTVKWVNGLVERGVKVTLITQHEAEAKIDDRVNIVQLPFRGGKGYLLNAIALSRVISKLNPDIVNVHYASGYGTLALLSRIKPYILNVWGSDVYEFPYQSRFKMWLIQKSLKNATHIASTSLAMAEQVREVVGDTELNITETPFGVDVELFKPVNNLFQRSVINIGLVKTLEHKYGIDILLRAFAILQKHYRDKKTVNLNLEVIGRGKLKERLEALARELDIHDSVQFVGAIDNAEVPKAINKIDIFVVPSRIESFGVSAIEAMACGRPCVVANTGGLPEVVNYGKVGAVADYESPESIAENIIELIDNQELAKTLGLNSRQYVLDKYSKDAALDTMQSLYVKFYENNR